MPVLERGQRELRGKVSEKAGHEKTGGAHRLRRIVT